MRGRTVCRAGDGDASGGVPKLKFIGAGKSDGICGAAALGWRAAASLRVAALSPPAVKAEAPVPALGAEAVVRLAEQHGSRGIGDAGAVSEGGGGVWGRGGDGAGAGVSGGVGTETVTASGPETVAALVSEVVAARWGRNRRWRRSVTGMAVSGAVAASQGRAEMPASPADPDSAASGPLPAAFEHHRHR